MILFKKNNKQNLASTSPWSFRVRHWTTEFIMTFICNAIVDSTIYLESPLVLRHSLCKTVSSTCLINSISILIYESNNTKRASSYLSSSLSSLSAFSFSAVLVWRLLNIPLRRPWEKSSDLNYAQTYLSVWQRPVVSCNVQQSWSEGRGHCSHIRFKMQ